MTSIRRDRRVSFLILADILGDEIATNTQHAFEQALYVFDAGGMVDDADAQCGSFVYPGWRDQVITFELNTVAYQGIQAIASIA